MNRGLVASVAIGAASTIAVHRLGTRPLLAAAAAASLAAAGVYASTEPELVIGLAIAALLFVMAMN